MTRQAGTGLTVAIAGLGAIGFQVARRLDDGIDGLALAAVSARDLARARAAGSPGSRCRRGCCRWRTWPPPPR